MSSYGSADAGGVDGCLVWRLILMNDRIMDLIMDKKIVVKTKEDIQMVYSSVSYYTELTIVTECLRI